MPKKFKNVKYTTYQDRDATNSTKKIVYHDNLILLQFYWLIQVLDAPNIKKVGKPSEIY